MTDGATLREEPVPGSVPRYDIPGWAEQYGVVAGITARGDGPPPGFDLGLWTQDPVGAVMGRWADFRHAQTGFHRFMLGHQVHGASVGWHGADRGWTMVEALDGHLTAATGVLLLVTVADCVPVYLIAPGRGVGLLHAGWRGTAAGILERGVTELAGRWGAPGDIIMHLGVGICGACYEVGSEVMAACGLPAPGQGPWHLDLRELLAQRAHRSGVARVTRSPWCSAHDRPRFYSHRASGGTDGRMVAYIGIPAPLAASAGD